MTFHEPEAHAAMTKGGVSRVIVLLTKVEFLIKILFD